MARPLGSINEVSPGVFRIRVLRGYEDGKPRYSQITHYGDKAGAEKKRLEMVNALHPAVTKKKKAATG